MPKLNLLYTLSFIFILFFVIREYAAYKRYISLKYFFTPSLTMLLVYIMIISVINNGADRYRVMVLLSLVMALTADTLLMVEEVNLLKNGIIFFIIGHVFYVGAFSSDASFEWWNLILILILGLFSIIYGRVLIKAAGNMAVPVLIYIFILDCMVYFAVTSLNDGISVSRILASAGAVLFMVSDFLLSLNAFVKKIPHSTVFTWLLYAPAQYLIVLSTFCKR